MKSRIIAILMTAVIFSTATQCGKSADAPASEATEAAQEAEQPVDGQETEQTEETQEEAQEAVTEAQDDGHVSDNPLLNAEKVVNDATNGSGQKIGEWESVLITAEILDAILSVFPLDSYVERPVHLTQVVPGDTVPTPEIWKTYKDIVAKYDKRGADAFEEVERFAFYEEAKKAYCIIATGETAVYANVLIQKGVVIN